MSRRFPSFAFAVACATVAACGHASPPEAIVAREPTDVGLASAARPAPMPAAGGAAPGGPPTESIRRSALRDALAAGPGAFLQKVTVDDQPVTQSGKFIGFRIASLQPDSFRGVDLKPGDVVTRVEGMPIEHPEEAIEAWSALQVASELRVDYQRDGVARMLRYRIVEDDAPQPATAMPAARPASRQ